MKGRKLIEQINEFKMSRSNMIRQVHRWTSALFTVVVIVVTVVNAAKGAETDEWVYLMPLPLLFLLLLTGVYLFALPYVGRIRKRRLAKSRAE